MEFIGSECLVGEDKSVQIDYLPPNCNALRELHQNLLGHECAIKLSPHSIIDVDIKEEDEEGIVKNRRRSRRRKVDDDKCETS